MRRAAHWPWRLTGAWLCAAGYEDDRARGVRKTIKLIANRLSRGEDVSEMVFRAVRKSCGLGLYL